jgi:hypothetical protein
MHKFSFQRIERAPKESPKGVRHDSKSRAEKTIIYLITYDPQP